MSEFEPHPPEEPESLDVSPIPPPPSRRRSNSLFWGMMGGCLLLFVLITIGSVALVAMMDVDSDIWIPSDSIAVVEIEGEIVDSRVAVDEIRAHASNPAIRAVVILVNTPGGAIVPSQEVYSEIMRARSEYEKPFVASLQGLAASGGYYIASACDEIVTNPGTLTGSIGVISQWMNLEGLLEWAHLESETITAGTMKDAGSPYRSLTEAERAYFKELLDEFHEQFIVAVAKGREGKVSIDEIRALADGRVFTGEQAVELKLADRIGTMHDAIAVAAELSGIEGVPNVVYPEEDEVRWIDLLWSARTPENLIRELVKVERPQPFAYRWY